MGLFFHFTPAINPHSLQSSPTRPQRPVSKAAGRYAAPPSPQAAPGASPASPQSPAEASLPQPLQPPSITVTPVRTPTGLPGSEEFDDTDSAEFQQV